MFQITITISIPTVALFESFHVSLQDFLHRLFDVLATFLLNFIATGSLLGPRFLTFLCVLKITFHMNLIIFHRSVQ